MLTRDQLQPTVDYLVPSIDKKILDANANGKYHLRVSSQMLDCGNKRLRDFAAHYTKMGFDTYVFDNILTINW